MSQVNFTTSLTQGIQTFLKNTWRMKYPKFDSENKLLMRYLPPTQLRRPPYGWKQTLPYPRYWPQGMPRQVQTFTDVLTYVTIRKYELSIEWRIDDQKDDLLNDLMEHVSTSLDRFGMLPSQLAAEYMNGVAVENILLELAYDGVPLFSDVDGDGNDRFGVADGNLLTGTGVTPADIIQGLHDAQRQFRSMTDPTSGKPIFEPSSVSFDKLLVIAPNSLNLAVQKAAEAKTIKTDPLMTVAEDNYIASKFSYTFNPFLTDTSDWFVLLKHPLWRPFIFRPPQDISSVITNINNSDRARQLGIAGIYADQRMGLGLWMPNTLIKISNS